MEFKGVPGFEDKFEIGEDGIVRNIKTKRETKPYHTSEKTGPMVHLLDTKAGKEARLSALKLVKDLFGKTVQGWDLDPDALAVKATVERKPRLSVTEKQARVDQALKEKAIREELRVKTKAAREAARALTAEVKTKSASVTASV
jgi:hypothetical protein